MYNMDLDKLPRRAVVPSQLSAEAEFRTWLRENCFDRMQDKDGLEWQVSVATDLETAGQWSMRIALSSTVDAPTFLRTRTLVADEDERLLSILGEHTIPLCMRPRVFRLADESEAQGVLAEELPRLRDELRGTSLIQLKRALIGRWVDSHHTFSERY